MHSTVLFCICWPLLLLLHVNWFACLDFSRPTRTFTMKLWATPQFWTTLASTQTADSSLCGHSGSTQTGMRTPLWSVLWNSVCGVFIFFYFFLGGDVCGVCGLLYFLPLFRTWLPRGELLMWGKAVFPKGLDTLPISLKLGMGRFTVWTRTETCRTSVLSQVLWPLHHSTTISMVR